MTVNKDFKQEKRTINDVEYTFQKLPIRKAMEIRQDWHDKDKPGGMDSIKMCDLVFEHIVVNPKIKLDDFEDIEEAEEVALTAVDFQYVSKGK